MPVHDLAAVVCIHAGDGPLLKGGVERCEEVVRNNRTYGVVVVDILCDVEDEGNYAVAAVLRGESVAQEIGAGPGNVGEGSARGSDLLVNDLRFGYVIIDRVALYRVCVHVQAHEAVAAVDGVQVEEEVAVAERFEEVGFGR